MLALKFYGSFSQVSEGLLGVPEDCQGISDISLVLQGVSRRFRGLHGILKRFPETSGVFQEVAGMLHSGFEAFQGVLEILRNSGCFKGVSGGFRWVSVCF